MKEVFELLEYLKTGLNLSEPVFTIIFFAIVLLFFVVKFFIFISSRIDAKDDKQFDMLYKIIEDDSFLSRLSNQPYLIKQLFYKRFYLLKDYNVEEVEFLMSQNSLKISLNQLTTLKSGHIIKFEDGRYTKTVNRLTNYWADNFRRFNFFIMLGFAFWILISACLCILLLKSTALFYASIIPLFILEVYLLVKIEAVKAYLKSQDYIDDFITQSIDYRDIHDA